MTVIQSSLAVRDSIILWILEYKVNNKMMKSSSLITYPIGKDNMWYATYTVYVWDEYVLLQLKLMFGQYCENVELS